MGSSKPEETQVDGKKENSIEKEVNVEKGIFPFNGTFLDFLFASIKVFS